MPSRPTHHCLCSRISSLRCKQVERTTRADIGDSRRDDITGLSAICTQHETRGCKRVMEPCCPFKMPRCSHNEEQKQPFALHAPSRAADRADRAHRCAVAHVGGLQLLRHRLQRYKMQRTSYYATHVMRKHDRPARIAGLGAQDRAGRTRSCAQARSLSQ